MGEQIKIKSMEENNPISLLTKQIEEKGWVNSISDIQEIKDPNQAMELARFLAPKYTSGFDEAGEGSADLVFTTGKGKGTHFEQGFKLRLMSYGNKLYLDIGRSEMGSEHKKIFTFNNEQEKEIIGFIPNKEKL